MLYKKGNLTIVIKDHSSIYTIFFFLAVFAITVRAQDSTFEKVEPPKNTIIINDSLIRQSFVYLPIQQGIEVWGGVMLGGIFGKKIGYNIFPCHDPFNVGSYMGMWMLPTFIYNYHIRTEVKRVKKELYEKYADYTIIDHSSRDLNFWKGFSFRVGTNVLYFKGKRLSGDKTGITLINSHEWPVYKGFYYGFEFSQSIAKAKILNKRILYSGDSGAYIYDANLDVQLSTLNIALLCKYKQPICSGLSLHVSMAPGFQFVATRNSAIESLRKKSVHVTYPSINDYDYERIYEKSFFDDIGNLGLAVDYGCGLQYADFFLEVRFSKSYNQLYCLNNLYFKEKLNTWHLTFGLLIE